MSTSSTDYPGRGFVRAGQGNGQVFLAAFGKHPGWGDFMDDIGMETEALIAAKRALYLEGIASQIETGIWAKLEPDKRIPDFNHLFLWRRSDEFFIGRIWSSSDAKGRREYPMVVCADCIELPISWALQELPPQLEEVCIACRSASSAAEVSAIIAKAQETIRGRIADSVAPAFNVSDNSAAHVRFLNRREWGPTQEGLYRILHQMHGQLSAYMIGRQASLSDTIFLRRTPQGAGPLSQQVRVPQAADTPAEALRQWNDFFLHKIDPVTPILFVLNLDHKWVDVTIGEPTHREFFSLKASQAALPLASEVPYELDEETREFARDFIASYGVQTIITDESTLARIRLVVGLLIFLILVTLFACYLHFAPAADIPDFLRSAAASLGNPALPPLQKP
jgi:hypothetical protein